MEQHRDTSSTANQTVSPPPSLPDFPQGPQRPASASASVSRKFPTMTVALGVVAILAVALIFFLFAGKEDSTPTTNALPSQMQMTADAKTVLSDNGISGSILDLEVGKESQSERFKTYVAECTVTVLSGDTKSEYAVTLRYEYANDSWTLSNLSEIKSK